MAKAKNKTVATDNSVKKFLDTIPDEKKRREANEICDLMAEVSGQPPVMWGSSIIGFGEYHYVYDSGREGDFLKIGFSPRKQNFSLYLMSGFDKHTDLLERLGKYKTGKACLYINSLDDVDKNVLRELAGHSYSYMTEKYG